MTTFYKKVGRKYVPVSDYDPELETSVPYKGSVLTVSCGNSTFFRNNVTPALAPFVAASVILSDDIGQIISEVSKAKLEDQVKHPITQEMRDIWDKMVEVCDLKSVLLPSYGEVANRVLEVIQTKVLKMMEDQDVVDAYNQFLLLCELKK